MVINEREYRELVEKAKAGEILSKAITLTSTLNYDGTKLSFDGDVINAVLQATAYPYWEARLEALKAEDAKKMQEAQEAKERDRG